MRWLPLLLPLLASCTRPAPPIPVTAEGELRAGPMQDPYAAARAELQARNERKERRFRDAWEPETSWQPLRVEQADVASRRVAGPKLVEIGRELFHRDFSSEQGLGNGLAAVKSPLAGTRPGPNLRHVHYKDFGGPDATRCVSCHHAGGEGGGGFRSNNALLDGDGLMPSSALERNAPALGGGALIQRLAEEMTAELRAQAARAPLFGPASPLSAKGVSFGKVRRKLNGRLDLSQLEGVDPDLVVRPFGRKGTEATLREAVELSLQQQLGIQSDGYLRRYAGQPGRIGPGPSRDPDRDGVTREATDGMVSALTTYLAALPPPIEDPLDEGPFSVRAAQGAEHFEKLGCASCHVPELSLDETVISMGPGRGDEPRFDLAPQLSSPGRTQRLRSVRLYSDLKRHDMGDSLAEPRDFRGVARRLWLTPPLWGVSASAPYMHDGRASTVDKAIMAHDGEGRRARDAYLNLESPEKGKLHTFLLSLTRPARLEFKY